MNLSLDQIGSLEVIHKSERSLIFKGLGDLNDEIIIKSDLTGDKIRLYNEATLSNLSLDDKLKARIQLFDQKTVISRPFIPGDTLKSIIPEEGFPIKDFLVYALFITEALASIHQKNLLHNDVNPKNFIIHPDRTKATLIDLEFSTSIQRQESSFGNTQIISGTLEYISPEQTGRMNRKVDFRSDFYSLGITFFEMLTGSLPFSSTDILELIHAHLAIIPRPPSVLKSSIPEPVDQIIAKLLKKNAEERYQSTQGLIKDLKFCLENIDHPANLTNFHPGQFDFSGKLLLSQKLYGRDAEIKKVEDDLLLAIKGKLVLTTVSGHSGTGKSELCQELQKKSNLNKTIFINGSFDVLDRQSPYLAFSKAFGQFSDWLFASNLEVQTFWKNHLHQKLHGLGEIILEMAPSLKYILPSQPTLLPLPGKENQRRLQHAIYIFLNAISEAKHTLVIQLDDLQWANEASLELLDSILRNPDLKNIHILATYRSNELSSHPFLKSLLQNLDQGNFHHLHFSQIALEPLALHHIEQLVSDSFKTSPDKTRELADILKSKTNGNPFAISKLLEGLFIQKLIYFDQEKFTWNWEKDKINTISISENILQVLIKKIENLEKKDLEVLKTASVFGLEFSLVQLSMVTGKPSSFVHRAIWPMIQDGSIRPMSPSYSYLPEYYEETGKDLFFRFSHAKIQQAIYSLLEEKSISLLHYKIGHTFLNDEHNEFCKAQPIEVALHFLRSQNYLFDSKEKSKIGKLLLAAGKKASESAAFESALKFNLLGLELLKEKLSKKQKFPIYLVNLEYAFLTDNKRLIKEMEESCVQNSYRDSNHLEVAEVTIRSLATMSLPQKAIEATRLTLQKEDISIPIKASLASVLFHILRMKFILNSDKIKNLSKLPFAKDTKNIAIAGVLNESLPSYLFANPETYPILTVKATEVALKNGLTPASPAAIASFGLILMAALRQYSQGYDLIQEALKMVENPEMGKSKATVLMVYIAFAAHLRNPLKDSFQFAEEGHQEGIRYGNMEYASWNIFFKATLLFHLGEDFQEVRSAVQRSRSFASQYNLHNQSKMMAGLEQALNIITSDQNNVEEELQNFLEENSQELEKAIAEKNNVFLFTYYGHMGNTCFWFGQYEKALACYKHFQKYAQNQPTGFFILFENINSTTNLYHLWLRNKSEKSALRKRIKWNIKELKELAQNNPSAFSGHYKVAQALEYFFRNGKFTEEKADTGLNEIRSSGQLRYIVIYAELFTEISKTLNPTKSEKYLNMAIEAALKIGSPAKAKQLLGFHTNKIKNQETFYQASRENSNSLDIQSLDSMTLIKSMEAIISEIKLEQLLKKLLTYAMENTGAQEGHFLINREGKWILEVSTKANHQLETYFPRAPLGESQEISESIVNYSKASQEPLLIEDAMLTKPFDSDPVVKQKALRSVLCIPFINQSKISGIIYLTHSLARNAFSKNQISLMRIMAAQIGGIIENSLLYENMERLVKERTKQLEEEKQKSDSLLLNILPKEVAEELINTGKASARLYERVSVMFIDIKDFTRIAQRLSPDELVKNLQVFFTRFDEIMDSYGIEKIKTIGDAYMAAGGIPVPNQSHPIDMIEAAFEILSFAEQYNRNNRVSNKPTFQVRIGIHIGPVVAGVVGHRKFAYDIWGDTVNIASRMETNSEIGRINISEDFYKEIKNQYNCEFRGEIDVKNKGMMNMYFVNHPKKQGYIET